MPADLPSLERLTADVAEAMRAAERTAQAGRRRWWRRTTPLVVTLLALVLAASALALHATAGKGAERTLPGAHCDAVHVVTAALVAGTVASGARCYRCAPTALSRRAGSPMPTPSLRPCA